MLLIVWISVVSTIIVTFCDGHHKVSPLDNVQTKASGQIQGKPVAANLKVYTSIIKYPIIKTRPIKQSLQILLPAIIRKLSSKSSKLSSARKPKLPKIIHQTVVINKTINVHPHPGKSVKISGGSHHSKQQKQHLLVKSNRLTNKNQKAPGQPSSSPLWNYFVWTGTKLSPQKRWPASKLARPWTK